ncbi:MAG: autotransporter-associated beta strand repeat-containing protein [Verrucomicrobiae bacterium]
MELIAVVLGSSIYVHAANMEWVNTGTDMSTGSSWNRGSVPTADSLYFSGTEGMNPNLSVSATDAQLVFNGTGYNLSTSSGQALTVTQTGSVSSNALQYYSQGANTISGNLVLGGASGQSFNMVGAGHLTISGSISGAQSLNLIGEPGTITLSGNNSFSGGFSTAKMAMVNINNNNALGTGTATFASSAALVRLGNTSGTNITLSNAVTFGTSSAFFYSSANNLTLAGALNMTAGPIPFYVNEGGGSLVLSGGIGTTTNSLSKSGAGTLVLGGTNLYTGVTTLNQGMLVLDKSLNSGSLSANNTLTFAGGGFTLKGAASGTSSQTLGNATFQAGANKIIIDSNGGSGTTLTLGNTWTASNGRSLNINLSSANSTLTSSPALTNGLIGGGDAYATVTDSAGTGFATVSGGSIVRNTTETNLLTNSNNSTANFVENTAGTLTMVATNSSVNSLRVDTSLTGASGVLDLNTSRMTVTSGGMLVTGTNGFTVQNGQLGGDISTIYLHQFSSENLTVSANTNFGAFIKDGTGTVTFSGSTGNTVNTYVNEGTVNITGKWSGASASSVTTISGGVLNLQNATTAAINNGTVTVQGTGTLTETAGINITGATTSLVVNGPSATANLLANSYGGNTTLTFGSVNVGDKASFGTGIVTMKGATVSATTDLVGVGVNAIANTFALNATSGATGTTVYFAGSKNLEFSGPGSLPNVSQTLNNSMTSTGSLIFSGAFTLGNNTLTLTGSGKTVISGNIDGGGTAGKIIKQSAGMLTLSGTNTYNGTTQVSAGVLLLNSANALPGGIGVANGLSNLILSNGVVGLGNGDFTRGLGTGVTQVQWGGTFPTGGGGGGFAAFGANRTVNLGGASAAVTWASSNFVSDGYDLILGAPDADFTLDFQNPISLNSVLRTIQVDNGSAAIDAKLSGVISNATGGLVKTGAGNLELTAANTYGGVNRVQSGTLSFNSGNVSAAGTQALGTNATVYLGVASASSGTLDYTGAGAGTLAKAVNAIGNGTDTIQNSGGGLLTLSGVLTKNGTVLTLKGGSTGINVTGSIAGVNAGSDLVIDGGVTTLSAASTYNGPTYIRNAATLNANVAGALPTGIRTAVIFDGTGNSTLVLGAHQNIASLTGASSAAVNINAHTLTVGTGAGSTAFSGNIGGAGGSLVKDDASTQILGGTNDYTGSTLVTAGTMVLSGTALATSGVTVSGGTLQLGASDRISSSASLVLSGGTFDVGGSFSQGLGILTLSGNSFITLSGGTLAFADSRSATWGAFTLDLTGFVSGTSLRFATSSSGLDATQLGKFTAAGFAASSFELDSSGYLTATAIPEPSTWLLVAAAGTFFMVMRRRRL